MSRTRCGLVFLPVMRKALEQNSLCRPWTVRGAPLSCEKTRLCAGRRYARQWPRNASSWAPHNSTHSAESPAPGAWQYVSGLPAAVPFFSSICDGAGQNFDP